VRIQNKELGAFEQPVNESNSRRDFLRIAGLGAMGLKLGTSAAAAPR
jgi:hypothetical protein